MKAKGYARSRLFSARWKHTRPTTFQTELCCYVCTEGTLVATLRDGSGRRFEGQVTVRFERGGCPDVSACCATADACPDPTLTQLCE